MNEDKSIGLYFRVVSKEIKQLIDSKLYNNLTNIQMCILCYINEETNHDKDIYQKNIEDLLRVRRSTVTEILNTMEKNDLIMRTSSFSDKRKKVLVLSSKGKKCVSDFEEIITGVEEGLFNGISCEEKEQFLIVLDKIRKNIKNLQEEIC